MTWPTGAVETRTHENNADVAGVGGTVIDATDQNWVYDLLERIQIKVGPDTDTSAASSVEGRLKALEAVSALTNPMSAVGDLIRGTTAGAPQRLAVGTAGQVLTVVGGLPAWADAASGDLSDPLTNIGDLIIRDATNATARLGVGTAGQLLGISGGVPAWVTPAYVSDPAGAPIGAVMVKNASGVWSYVAPATSGYVLTDNGVGAAPTFQVIPISSPGTGITTPAGVRVGDLVQYNELGAWVSIHPGMAGQYLTAHGDNNVAGSKLTWTTPGTAFTSPMMTLSDMIYADTGGTPLRLPIGTNGKILTVVAGAPAWATAAVTAAPDYATIHWMSGD